MHRLRSGLIVVLFLVYGVSILLWLVDRASGLYLPSHWPGGFFAFFGIPVFGFSIFVWALLSPRSWARWRLAGPALLLGALALWSDVGLLRRRSNERFLQKPELNAFAAQIHAYGRISQMWEWPEGFTHSLNGTVVRRTSAELDSLPSWLAKDRETALLAEVLARDSIDAAVYEDMRQKLRRFHLQSINVHGDYVLLRRSRDGGLVYATRGAPALESGKTLPGTGWVIGDRIGQWYFIWCCAKS